MEVQAAQFKSNVAFKVGRGSGATMTAIVGAQIGRHTVKSLRVDTDRQVLVMTAEGPDVPPAVIPLSNVSFVTLSETQDTSRPITRRKVTTKERQEPSENKQGVA